MKGASLISDSELLDRVRQGDNDAFGVLWARHSAAVLRVAKIYARNEDPEDLVSQAFTNTLHALMAGKGPRDSIRAYLYTAVRNAAASKTREFSTDPEAMPEVPDDDAQSDPVGSHDVQVRTSLLSEAFSRLPRRWQAVLWYLHVEELRPREVAKFMGTSSNGLTNLAKRARLGLRAQWIQEHVESPTTAPLCRTVLALVGSVEAGTASSEKTAFVQEHIAECPVCTRATQDALISSQRLGFVLIPSVLGLEGTQAWLDPSSTLFVTSGHAGVTTSAALGSSKAVLATLTAAGTALLGATVVLGVVIANRQDNTSPAAETYAPAPMTPFRTLPSPPSTTPVSPTNQTPRPFSSSPASSRPQVPNTSAPPSTPLPSYTASAPPSASPAKSPATTTTELPARAPLEAPSVLAWQYNVQAQSLHLEGERVPGTDLAIHAQQLGRTTVLSAGSSNTWQLDLDRVPPGRLDIYLTSTRGEENSRKQATLLLEGSPNTAAFTARQCSTSLACLDGTGAAGATVAVSDSEDTSLGSTTVADDGTWTLQLASIDPVKSSILTASLRLDPADTPSERDVPITPAVIERSVGFLNRSILTFQGLPGQRIEVVDASTLKPIPHLLSLRTTLDAAGTGTIALPIYVLDQRQFVVRYLNSSGKPSNTGTFFSKSTVPLK